MPVGTGGSDMQGQSGSRANAPPAMFDNSSPEDWSRAYQPPPPDQPVVCEVMLPEGLELSSDCPQIHPTRGDTCTLAPNLACIYGTAPSPGEASGVLVETCETVGQDREWVFRSSATCKRETCSLPEAPLVSVDVDASSCAQRTPQPCSEGVTAQAQLDSTFSGLLDRLKLWPGMLATVGIVLENGCPIELWDQHRSYDAAQQMKLSNALAEIRWACAEDLSCTRAFGPAKGD